jgi:hypothetical protein
MAPIKGRCGSALRPRAQRLSMIFATLRITNELAQTLCGASNLVHRLPCIYGWRRIIAGLCRLAFKLDEEIALLSIGLPLFLVLLSLFIRFLPKHLRKAGMLSAEPKKFGPWFEQGS